LNQLTEITRDLVLGDYAKPGRSGGKFPDVPGFETRERVLDTVNTEQGGSRVPFVGSEALPAESAEAVAERLMARKPHAAFKERTRATAGDELHADSEYFRKIA